MCMCFDAFCCNPQVISAYCLFNMICLLQRHSYNVGTFQRDYLLLKNVLLVLTKFCVADILPCRLTKDNIYH